VGVRKKSQSRDSTTGIRRVPCIRFAHPTVLLREALSGTCAKRICGFFS